MIKKLLWRLIFLVVVFLILSPLILTHQDGNPIMSMEEVKSFDMGLYMKRYGESFRRFLGEVAEKSELGADLERNISERRSPESTERIFYKWKDEKGEWHFSDTRPDSYDVEEIIVNINQNILNLAPVTGKDKKDKERKEKN